MESDRRIILIQQEKLPRVLAYGLLINAIGIIMSVQFLYDNQKWLEFGITTCLFTFIVYLIRRFINAKT